MEMNLKVKLLLGIAAADITKDTLIDMLLEDAIAEVTDYCNLKIYDSKFDSTVVKMVSQNYNKVSTQGISSQSFSGVSESFVDGYSADVMTMLNKSRRVRFL